MNEKILVAYATSSGSTQEIAESVAATLREAGFAVDVQPARKVRSLQGYCAVVLGAPLYMFHWHADARNFLARQRKAIQSGLPLAIFAGGPMDKGDEKEWQGVREQMDKELAKFPWLTPLSLQLVGGKFDPANLRFPYTLIPALKAMPAKDLRDWDAIRAWARSLPAVFSLAPAGN